ncbi:MAG: V-type ATP synthase subunit I [Erysipelotrichaceae bacterium]
MSIAKMRLLHINFDKENLQDVLLRLSAGCEFHPVQAQRITERVGGLKTLKEENPYTDVVQRLVDTANLLGVELLKGRAQSISIDLNEVKSLLDNVEDRVLALANVRNDVATINAEYEDSIKHLQYMNDAQFSLDDVFDCRYLKVRFGRLPIDNLPKLSFYDSHPFVFKSFKSDAAYSWCVYFTTLDFEGDADNIFSALQFERIRIPSFFHGTPDEAIKVINSEIESNKVQLDKIEKRLLAIREEYLPLMADYYAKVNFLNETFETRKYVVDLGGEYTINGFADPKSAKKIEEEFKGIAHIDNLPPESDKRLQPPTKLSNGWFSKPFELFVNMYGTPGYNDLDPTFFVAISYTVLFGLMFADLGQGILLALFSWFLAKKYKIGLAEIGIRIGIASAIFGFFLGSVFGNEEILVPLFKETLGISWLPIHVLDKEFTMILLGITIFMGVVLISTAITINIVLRFKEGNKYEALLSHNGVAGLLMYLSLLFALVGSMLLGLDIMTPAFLIPTVGIPVFCIFFKEPIIHFFKKQPLFPHGVGGFITETFFEMFEVFLSFAANTMSFLRVGGFVLSHAGMMLVVYTLAGMVPSGFYYIVIIIGNLFVMGLEGMIVGIQVLRLEFYEMFSRYFEGNGIAFQSIHQ